MTKNKILISSLLAIVLLAGCSQTTEPSTDQNNENQVSESTEAESNIETQEATTQTPKTKKQAETNSISYYNEAYDFSLEFPSTWKNYTVTPEITTNSKQTYYFGFEEQFDIFAVSIFTEDQWNLIYSEGGPKPTELGRKNGYIIGYEVGQDAVSSEIYERFVDVPQIISTFK